MLRDSLTLEHFSPEDIANLRGMMLTLLKNDLDVGKWTDKTEVRQTGCTIHIKYGKKAAVSLDGRGSSNVFANILLKSPDIFFSILVKLFEVDEDDMPLLLEEARAHVPA